MFKRNTELDTHSLLQSEKLDIIAPSFAFVRSSDADQACLVVTPVPIALCPACRVAGTPRMIRVRTATSGCSLNMHVLRVGDCLSVDGYTSVTLHL